MADRGQDGTTRLMHPECLGPHGVPGWADSPGGLASGTTPQIQAPPGPPGVSASAGKPGLPCALDLQTSGCSAPWTPGPPDPGLTCALEPQTLGCSASQTPRPQAALHTRPPGHQTPDCHTHSTSVGQQGPAHPRAAHRAWQGPSAPSLLGELQRHRVAQKGEGPRAPRLSPTGQGRRRLRESPHTERVPKAEGEADGDPEAEGDPDSEDSEGQAEGEADRDPEAERQAEGDGRLRDSKAEGEAEGAAEGAWGVQPSREARPVGVSWAHSHAAWPVASGTVCQPGLLAAVS